MPFDVVVVTALFEELNYFLEFTDDEVSRWREDRDPGGFRFHYRDFWTNMRQPMRIAAAWAGQMGEVASADRCRSLISHLDPLCVAMTGICAGRRGSVFLGDVIVANRVFSYDHGKLIAVTSEDGHRVEHFFHDIETYNLERTWAMDAAYFASKRHWCERLLDQRPPSVDVQRMWVLYSLFEYETSDAPSPIVHPDRKILCPRWSDVVLALQKEGLIILESGALKLSTTGREIVLNDRIMHPDGPVSDPGFRVHVGPIGSGKTVRQDPEIFQRLARLERNVLGLEMEATAIGYVAENAKIPSIIVKAVTDYADERKDDSFRAFACRASAEFLLAFLKEHPPSSLQRGRQRVPASDLEEMAKIVSAQLLNSFLNKGAELILPLAARLNRSLFYCTTSTGSRVLGVALNNNGLIVYASTEELVKAVSLQGDVRSTTVRHIEGNRLIRFAVLDCPTNGLPSSYWDISEFYHHPPNNVWISFDHLGNPIKLTLSGINSFMVVDLNEDRFVLEDLIEASAAVNDPDVLSGPVITDQNELVGIAILKSGNSTAGGTIRKSVHIWPWVSLKSCLNEAKIEEAQKAIARWESKSAAGS